MSTTGPSSSDSVTCCPGAARSENSGARVPGRSALETVVLVDIAKSSPLRDSSNCWVCPALSLSTDFQRDATEKLEGTSEPLLQPGAFESTRGQRRVG